MSKINYTFTPFNEEQLNQAIKRLAFIFATRMGWIPKELVKKKKDTTFNVEDTEVNE